MILIEQKNNLREIRLKLGLKLTDVSRIFSISKTFLSLIENGKKNCPDTLHQELLNYYQLIDQREGLEAMFDYVRVRIPTHNVKSVIEDILQMNFELFYTKTTGLYGYIQMYEYDNIRVLESIKGDDRGVLIELSGMGCRNYEYVLNELDNIWLDFFSRCLVVGGVVKRIDIAIDDYVEYFSLVELNKKRKKKEMETSFRKTRSIDSEDESTGESDGVTIYFGTRNSLVYFCFYQKNYQLAYKEKIPLNEIDVKNRYEVRLHNERAQKFIDYYLEDTFLLRSVRSVIGHYLTFTQKNRSGVTQMWKPWREFLGATTYVDLSMKAEKPSFERKFRWAKNYCSQALKIFEIAGKQLGINYIDELLCVDELSERNEKILEWHLAEHMELLSYEGKLIAKETGEIIK
ncbi:replication initiation factor domain-containing protein [Enterococcus faecalis]|uniref:replication initiation factor domain-containing protein n=1 Tax=Enterococcus faecalis TaxID=1351 RepID=UPI003137C172